MNINDNNRKDDVKTDNDVKAEDGEIIGNVGFRYNGDDYKDLIDIFTYGLKVKDLHLTNIDYQIGLKKYC